MRINPLANNDVWTGTSAKNRYDLKLQAAKQNLLKNVYIQQVERDYFQRNVRPR